MRQTKPGQQGRSSSIRKNKNWRKTPLGIILIVMCVTAFLSGRALAESNDSQYITVKTNQTAITTGQTSSGPIQSAKTPKTENTDAWNLVLVNKTHPIKENNPIQLVQLKNGQAIDERAYPELQAMMDDARAAGLSPYICSSYRTNEKQTTLYNNQVNQYRKRGYSEADAAAEAGKWVAIPGTSEHQIGLAVDIVAKSYQVLDKKQESTAEQRWLMENCHKYGFILRYPSEKSEITGIGYEPWHYRYVGKDAAAAIMKEGKCLEEYLDGLSSSIAGAI
ncbi:M15 family metallopeptidase [Anoxybacterium hadale]|uniref:M15 family metallopeptidase n=1 Tax=Anoxybacterium hadale TaxID=3408580 RepID=A0ACD1A657_9FIRM|nr:M15 family metallopeptidase [Clostridiales bacterium]